MARQLFCHDLSYKTYAKGIERALKGNLFALGNTFDGFLS